MLSKDYDFDEAVEWGNEKTRVSWQRKKKSMLLVLWGGFLSFYSLMSATFHIFFSLSSFLNGIIVKMFFEAAKFEFMYAVYQFQVYQQILNRKLPLRSALRVTGSQ